MRMIRARLVDWGGGRERGTDGAGGGGFDADALPTRGGLGGNSIVGRGCLLLGFVDRFVVALVGGLL